MSHEADAYDNAVEYLTANPHRICQAWSSPTGHPAGILFGYVTKSRGSEGVYGCLTMVKGGDTAATPALTLAIQADHRIPKDVDRITVADLHIFAEWQRRIDKELGRTPPKFSTNHWRLTC